MLYERYYEIYLIEIVIKIRVDQYNQMTWTKMGGKIEKNVETSGRRNNENNSMWVHRIYYIFLHEFINYIR